MTRIRAAWRRAALGLITTVALASCTQTALHWGHDPSSVEPVKTVEPTGQGVTLAVLRLEQIEGMSDGYYGVEPDERGGLNLVHLADLDDDPPLARARTITLGEEHLAQAPVSSVPDFENGDSMVAFAWFEPRFLGSPIYDKGLAYEHGVHIVRAFVPSDDGAEWSEIGSRELHGRPRSRLRRWSGNLLAIPAVAIDLVLGITVVAVSLGGGIG